MEAELVARYDALTRGHWWWRARTRVVLEHVAAQSAAAGRPLRMLDVGCANGYLLPALARFGTAEGLEPMPGLRPGSGGGTIHAAPLETFTPAAPFDLLLMLDVIEHVADPVALLRHAGRVLAPRGALIVTVPAGRALWTSHDDLNEHLRRYDPALLVAQLGAAGFVPDRTEFFFPTLVIAKLAQRALEAVRPPAPRPPAMPPRWLNAAADGYLRAERLLTRRLSLPFGASLIATARFTGRQAPESG